MELKSVNVEVTNKYSCTCKQERYKNVHDENSKTYTIPTYIIMYFSFHNYIPSKNITNGTYMYKSRSSTRIHSAVQNVSEKIKHTKKKQNIPVFSLLDNDRWINSLRFTRRS